MVRVDLTEAQLKALVRARDKNQGYSLKLSRKQVMQASDESPHELPLNRLQLKQFAVAKEDNKPVVLNLSKTALRSRSWGGFFGAIVPFLASMLPGLLGAAPQILDGVKSGYQTIGKLVKGKAVEGASLQNFGSGNESEGSSLQNFGESLLNFGMSAPDAPRRRAPRRKPVAQKKD